MTDPLAAIKALLLADAAVAALAGHRVYGIELPASEAAHMPRKAVVVRPAGGISPVGGFVDLTGGRIEIIAWGETAYEAALLAGAVFGALKPVRREVAANVLVHWIEDAGGPTAIRDPDTGWPAAVQPYQVLYATIPVAA